MQTNADIIMAFRLSWQLEMVRAESMVVNSSPRTAAREEWS